MEISGNQILDPSLLAEKFPGNRVEINARCLPAGKWCEKVLLHASGPAMATAFDANESQICQSHRSFPVIPQYSGLTISCLIFPCSWLKLSLIDAT